MAVSADDAAGCAAMRALTRGKIEIVADPFAAFIARLGLAASDSQVDHRIARPATFVVDAAGMVRYRYIGRSPDDRPKVALLLLAAERLASGVAPLRTP